MENLVAFEPPRPHQPPRTLQRQRTHICSNYIRKVKGERYQLRWWLGGFGSINCGLYRDEWTANRVKVVILKRLRSEHETPLGLWRLAVEVIEEFRNSGHQDLPIDLLPMWVVRRSDGALLARVRKAGQNIELPGPFATPDEAHLAMAAVIPVTKPKPKPKPKPRRTRSPRLPENYPWVFLRMACRLLGVSNTKFRRFWSRVFTNAGGMLPRVLSDELTVALDGAKGGDEAAAFEAVLRFRETQGRLKFATVADIRKRNRSLRRVS